MVVCIHGRNVINANSVARVLVIQVIFCATSERIQERSLIDAMTVEYVSRIQEIALDMLEWCIIERGLLGVSIVGSVLAIFEINKGMKNDTAERKHSLRENNT